MFKEMRRKEKQLSKEQSIEILKKCQYGVLSVVGENGYAYGVPLSYVYVDNKIYFHSALTGYKLDCIRYNNKVSFCVVGETNVLPDKFDTEYESVIVFGKAEEVTGDENYFAHIELLKKYSGDYMEEGKKYLEKAGKHTRIFKIDIDYMTGKLG
jgi:nitroimidazol reductase NimA-like FMN-containing flavoprotein (pyridoxamine 5'-phosphate oxidase superfamily)